MSTVMISNSADWRLGQVQALSRTTWHQDRLLPCPFSSLAVKYLTHRILPCLRAPTMLRCPATLADSGDTPLRGGWWPGETLSNEPLCASRRRDISVAAPSWPSTTRCPGRAVSRVRVFVQTLHDEMKEMSGVLQMWGVDGTSWPRISRDGGGGCTESPGKSHDIPRGCLGSLLVGVTVR